MSGERAAQAPGWRSQFGHPRGLLGRLAGHVMAVKNAEMHRLTVEILDPKPGDRVLEIGFGHGRMLGTLASRVGETGLVAGVDPSEAMVRQAARRNRAWLARGRVELALGGVSRLPWPAASFCKACAVNSFQHWPQPSADLAEVRRVLEPGGLLVLALRMHAPDAGRFASPGFEPEQVERAAALVRAAGFADVRRELRQGSRDYTFVLGKR